MEPGRRSAMEVAAVLETAATQYEEIDDGEMRVISAFLQRSAEMIAQGRVEELYQAISQLKVRPQDLELQELVHTIERLSEKYPKPFE